MRDEIWVFVGCGGTFFHALTMYQALVAKYRPERVLCIDPDVITEDNRTRQWFGATLGARKGLAAASYLEPADSLSVKVGAAGWESDIVQLMPDIHGGRVLWVVNVDNHEARRELVWWVRRLAGDHRMVVSGCDKKKGQVWWGHWRSRGALFDWLELHPDVANGDGMMDPAYGQDVKANAATGFLSATMIQSYLEDGNSPRKQEVYWQEDEETGLIKTWALEGEEVRDHA